MLFDATVNTVSSEFGKNMPLLSKSLENKRTSSDRWFTNFEDIEFFAAVYILFAATQSYLSVDSKLFTISL